VCLHVRVRSTLFVQTMKSMLEAIDSATAATGIHDGIGLLLDETVRLRCVTPVESYMDRLKLLFLCSVCSARCLRTPYFCLHTCLFLPPIYIWPPYTCISCRYACVLGTCVNVSLWACTKNVCTGRQLALYACLALRARISTTSAILAVSARRR
jgi:hypothetical protein